MRATPLLYRTSRTLCYLPAIQLVDERGVGQFEKDTPDQVGNLRVLAGQASMGSLEALQP